MAGNRDKTGRFRKGHTGNPKGRPRKDSTTPREDGWDSLLTGLGTSLDKRQYTTFSADVIDYHQAVSLLRGDDTAATAVEKLPDESLRAGFELQAQSDDDSLSETKDLQESIEMRWDDLGALEQIRKAAKFERGFGGAGIILGVDDGGVDLRKPLDYAKVRSLNFLTTLEARELSPAWYYANPMAPKFGEVAIWRASPISPGVGMDGFVSANDFEIHESRLILFPGIRVSNQYMAENGGWGDSILTRIWRVLRDFNMAWDGTGYLMQDFSQAIYKMKGLAEIVAADASDVFKDRLKALELSRSVIRAMIIDEGEDFERKTTQVSGLPELLDRFESRMAAATGMPITILFGRSPAGLNATGESDIRQWYDTVDDWRDRKIIPALKKITKCLLAEQSSEPASWDIVGKPLWQPSDQEVAATRKTNAETDAIYINSGVVYPEEIAHNRFGGDGYSAETIIDFEAREELEALEEQKEAEIEARAAAMLSEQPPNEQMPAQPDSGDAESEADAKESEPVEDAENA